MELFVHPHSHTHTQNGITKNITGLNVSQVKYKELKQVLC